MPTIEKVFEELQWLSDRISSQVRTISVSLLIITWGLIIGRPNVSSRLTEGFKKNLMCVGILALVVLLGDFLQYFFGYINNDCLRKKIERTGQNEAEYDYNSKTYKIRGFLFWFKQIALLIACFWFLFLMIPFCIKAFCET